jgi:uncharacterized RDD family membrane protein YckC
MVLAAANGRKFCKHCGHPIDSDSNFCADCGGSLLPMAAADWSHAKQPKLATHSLTEVAPDAQPFTDNHLNERGGEIPYLAPAWPRYWARCIDILLELFLLGALVGATQPTLFGPGGAFSGSSGGQAFAVVLLPFALLIESVMTAMIGTTPGKWIAGLKLRDIRGDRLTLTELLRRNSKLYVGGLGGGIWIISLFTLANNHSKVKEHKLTSWDQDTQSRVFQTNKGGWRTHLAAAVYVILLLICLALPAALRRSPEAQLAEAASEVNKTAPRTLDSDTRLDGAETAPGLILQYDYTLVNAEALSVDMATFTQWLQGDWRTQMTRKFCAEPAFRPIWNLGANIRLKYSDKNGRTLGTLAIPNGECTKHGAL